MTKPQGKSTAGEGEMEVERSVLAYLHSHPQAADTLRGIVNWWLPRQRYEISCQRIEHVLGRLVTEGLLHRDELPDGEVLYALNDHTKPPRPH
ncbi:MAG TPA: hypothetical protein VIO59_03195 [Rhodanobacter sp.]|jgi:Fe2+ or Zn2+ uptake regulation protein